MSIKTFKPTSDGLRHAAQHRIAGNEYASRVRGFFAPQYAKQGGLAAAIDAHEAYVVALLHLEAHVFKQQPRGKAFFKLLNSD